tara:strand:+ start:542 stop:1816 length:1275 start_codon:yes stop_codon:yes gene_type:complete
MLDIKEIRENPDLFQNAADAKGCKISIKDLLQVDEQRRKLSSETDTLRMRLKEGNQKIRSLSKEEKPAHIQSMKEVSNQVKELETKLKEVQLNYDNQMLLVPSLMDSSVPIGKDDRDNVVIDSWGDIPNFDFEPKSHVELGDHLNLMDIQRGVKLSGTRFYYLKNEGTMLELAVMRYALDFLIQRGFTPMTVPVLVREHAMMGTGYFPGGEDQAYKMKEDDLYLVGTAEVSLASYHYDEILDVKQLPIKSAAWSNCFRREAGTYGKDTHGLYRIHQFMKVEQVIVMEEDDEKSLQMLDYLLKNATDFLQSLEVPYQVVAVCSGDIGQGQVKKYDINSWMPSRNEYCETHSASMFKSFQAKRLKLRYKDENGKNRICYTLNNTLIASPRILIPLLELNQTNRGTITIPKVLVPYMNGIEEIKPKE